MSAHPAYAEEAAPEPFKVLGRKLLPFTVGHQVLLERFQSGYAVGASTPPTWEDFILAVWICSRTYSDFLRDLDSVWTFLRIRLWALRCGKFDVGEAQQFFRSYFEQSTAEPVYFRDDDCAAEEIGIPWGLFLKQHTQDRLGIDEASALRSRYVVANRLYLAHLAERGIIQFASQRQLRMIDMAQRLQQKGNN